MKHLIRVATMALGSMPLILMLSGIIFLGIYTARQNAFATITGKSQPIIESASK